jgi:serine/threonine protein kinase
MIKTNPDDRRIQNIQKWMLEVIDAIGNLHSRGIIHRDLVMRNILEAEPLVLCDLESMNADYHCKAFELDDDDCGIRYTFETDIFALGSLLWEMCFMDRPPSRAVLLDRPPPPPFRDIFLACTEVDPEDRPTLQALKGMYEAI